MHKLAACIALISLLPLAACDGDDDDDDDGGPSVRTFTASLTGGAEPHEQFTATLGEGQEPHTRFLASLSGDQEVPPVTTTASGNATFTVTGDEMAFTLDVADIDSATAAHIHNGPPGVSGGIMVGLFDGPTTGLDFTDRLADGTRVAVDSVVQRMLAGEAYVNVHTREHPPGEIRGQIQLVSTGATGSAVFTLNGSTLSFRLDVADIDSATAAHIHAGGPGVAGGIMVPLFQGPPKDIGFSGNLAQGTVEIHDSVAARLRNGTAYVNVHTRANPAGHIRGQVALVTVDATGMATFTLRDNDLTYELDVTGVDSATQAHIHLGEPGVSGPVLIGLFSGPTTGLDFTGQLASGTVMVPDSVVTHMGAGRTYVNVHTTAIPAGAIRGQIQEQ